MKRILVVSQQNVGVGGCEYAARAITCKITRFPSPLTSPGYRANTSIRSHGTLLRPSCGCSHSSGYPTRAHSLTHVSNLEDTHASSLVSEKGSFPPKCADSSRIQVQRPCIVLALQSDIAEFPATECLPRREGCKMMYHQWPCSHC